MRFASGLDPIDVQKAWRYISGPVVSNNAILALALEASLLQSLEHPTLRIWQNAPCLVLGRFDARLPGVREATVAFAQSGVVLLQRASGGTAVWHGPGVLNVSLFWPPGMAPHGVHQTFEVMAEGMLKGLRALGIEAGFGRIPGTYCDGPHNLVASERKLAGLAQVRRKRGVLVHASLLVDLDLDAMHDRLEYFYELAGRPARFRRDGVATLVSLRGPLGVTEVEEAIANAYRALGARLEPVALNAADFDAAKALTSSVVVGAS